PPPSSPPANHRSPGAPAALLNCPAAAHIVGNGARAVPCDRRRADAAGCRASWHRRCFAETSIATTSDRGVRRGGGGARRRLTLLPGRARGTAPHRRTEGAAMKKVE